MGWIIIGLAILLPALRINLGLPIIISFQFMMIIMAVVWILKDFEGSPTEDIEIDKIFKVLKIIKKKSSEKCYLILEEYGDIKKEPFFCKINKARLPKEIKEGICIMIKNNKFVMTQK